MSAPQVDALPIKRFWFMSGAIDRIQAERDLRGLSVAAAAATGPMGGNSELMMLTREKLNKERGDIYVVDEVQERQTEEMDAQGLAELRAMQDD